MRSERPVRKVTGGQNGFTLLELAVVIVCVIILVTVVFILK